MTANLCFAASLLGMFTAAGGIIATECGLKARGIAAILAGVSILGASLWARTL